MGFKHALLNNFALIPDLSSPAVLKKMAITTSSCSVVYDWSPFYYFQRFKDLAGRTKTGILNIGNPEL